MSVVLGKRYRDTLTGCEGVATVYAEYLHAEPKAALERLDSSGNPVDNWFPVARLELVGDFRPVGFGSRAQESVSSAADSRFEVVGTALGGAGGQAHDLG